jgi:hypothetical protein
MRFPRLTTIDQGPITGAKNRREVMAKAHTIVNSFHRSKKQYAILRSKQEKPQEKPSALILAVITRWGTQFTLITSLLKCKSALFAWLGDPQAQMGQKKGENILAATVSRPESPRFKIRVVAVPCGRGASSLSKSLIVSNMDLSGAFVLGTRDSSSSTHLS